MTGPGPGTTWYALIMMAAELLCDFYDDSDVYCTTGQSARMAAIWECYHLKELSLFCTDISAPWLC